MKIKSTTGSVCLAIFITCFVFTSSRYADSEITILADQNGVFEYTDNFQTKRFLKDALVSGFQDNGWTAEVLKNQGPHSWHLTYHFQDNDRIKDIEVQVGQEANGPNLGGRNTLLVSRNGIDRKTAMSSSPLRANQNGWQYGFLTIKPAQEDELLSGKELWLHLKLDNVSGLPTKPSNSIHQIKDILTMAQLTTSEGGEQAPDPKAVAVAYREYAMQTTGDPASGEKVFSTEKFACRKCHTIKGKQRSIGPNLTGIADKYSREKLVEAVLDPNAYVLSGYATTVVVTKSGKVHTGLVQKHSNDTLQLVDGTGTIATIATAEIEEQRGAGSSLMPTGIQTLVSREQFADLIAFLQTLKQPSSQGQNNFATPNEISSIQKPIQLQALDTQFEQPVWVGAVPGINNGLAVVEQRVAKVWLIENTGTGVGKSLFLDISQETYKGTNPDSGLMSIAFHPDFRQNRKYYFLYHVIENGIFSSVVAERQATEDLRQDAGIPTRQVLRMDQRTDLHFGGNLVFGADGYLYIGIGDGGPQEDPEGHAQDLHLLNGSILRIDVDGRQENLPYRIPPSNPFYNDPDKQIRREIWAYGMRMPWRFNFDPQTNELWTGDVGQVGYEEISIVRGGENHGWNVYEGFAPFTDRYQKENTQYVPPVFALARKHGVSITGGHVYRGSKSPSFQGVYIFGDYQSRKIWGLTQEDRKLKKIREIGISPQRIVSFGLDWQGELHLVGYAGTVYKMHFENSVFE